MNKKDHYFFYKGIIRSFTYSSVTSKLFKKNCNSIILNPSSGETEEAPLVFFY